MITHTVAVESNRLVLSVHLYS